MWHLWRSSVNRFLSILFFVLSVRHFHQDQDGRPSLQINW
jgi:hypothetical protein